MWRSTAAARRLNLDDLGAEVGEQPAAVGAELVGEFDDAEAFEGAVRHG